MTNSPAAQLRQLLAMPTIITAPGAYDGISAKLIADAGFPAVYMTGAGVSASKGYPDYGLVTMSEMVDAASIVARTAGIPLISDADTGYGNELNVTRTVREFEARGVAAIHIEDQLSPKRCGHIEGKELVGIDEYCAKIRAAVAARHTPDFVIIARTDAIAVGGFDEAIARAKAALLAGADMIFIEAPPSMEALAAIPELIGGACVANMVPGGKTPVLPPADLQSMGFRLAIYPGACLLPVVQAIDANLAKLAGRDEAHLPMGPAEFFARFGSGEWDALRSGQKDSANVG